MKSPANCCDLCGSPDVWDVFHHVTLCWDCESTVASKVLFEDVPFTLAVELLRARIQEVDNA